MKKRKQEAERMKGENDMQGVNLSELLGGAVQQTFQNSLKKVMENLLDLNTPYKTKRSITIKLTFDQNEMRDDVKVHIDVSEKLAPTGTLETAFVFGKNLETGEIVAEEYGKQIKGQLHLNDRYEELDDGRRVDLATGEIEENGVIDMRVRKAR